MALLNVTGIWNGAALCSMANFISAAREELHIREAVQAREKPSPSPKGLASMLPSRNQA